MCMCSAGDGGGGDNASGGDFLCPALCCLKIYDKYCDLLLVPIFFSKYDDYGALLLMPILVNTMSLVF